MLDTEQLFLHSYRRTTPAHQEHGSELRKRESGGEKIYLDIELRQKKVSCHGYRNVAKKHAVKTTQQNGELAGKTC